MDIVIYTTRPTLHHKLGIGEPYSHYFWSLSRRPQKFEKGDKIFFAVDKKVVGSFTSEAFGTCKKQGKTVTEITWDKHTWKPLDKPIYTESFRGFKYRWW